MEEVDLLILSITYSSTDIGGGLGEGGEMRKCDVHLSNLDLLFQK